MVAMVNYENNGKNFVLPWNCNSKTSIASAALFLPCEEDVVVTVE